MLLGSAAASAAASSAAPGERSEATQTATASHGAASFDVLFPRYRQIEAKVQFWKQVFGGYSELQTIVHSSEIPWKVLRVIDHRGKAATMSEAQFDNYRRKADQDAREAMERLIASVHAKRHAPQSMNAEERRIFELFKDQPGDDRFARLRGTIRTQRGIKERTERALQVADAYLPYMEQIFAGYGLPKALTRLPIVESSFNVEAYSRSHAAGVWQFIPASAKLYMRLDEVVDDRRDPWTSTDAAARHLRDDYALLQDWPLAVTAYNHGRYGIARGLKAINGKTLVDLIERGNHPRWGFAGKNYYAEFLAAVELEREWRQRSDRPAGLDPIEFEIVETKHYVPYETLRRLSGGDDELFRKLNPAYRPDVIDGKLYVPPGHLIRVPAGSARSFEVGYARLGEHERFDSQRVYFLLHKVRKGETLGGIAREYRTSVEALQRVNGLRGSMIRIGQVIKVPPREEARPGPISVAVGESKPALTRSQIQAARREAAVHIVSRGDTLAAIARRYRVSEASLRAANGLSSSLIRVGQRLDIPVEGRAPITREHRVRSGQTLSSIAREYDVSIEALRRANGLGTSSLIKVGQTLQVPQD
ncbi:LysM peptidoglycan-binding domain-containing protein [Sinimarinibacterium thermocellulolyticum]|uniref:LysM peptidoglycan-binding domain-containing protein n=1 Tax=Sinimarinibacterium thermocellulolyticum TaxID=3170016 RepID=A0ABV2A7Y4_9GAMM